MSSEMTEKVKDRYYEIGVIILMVLGAAVLIWGIWYATKLPTSNPRQEFNTYIEQNIPFTNETLDKIVLNTNSNSSGQLYIALLNAEPVYYEKFVIEDNITSPYISCKKVPMEVIKKYGFGSLIPTNTEFVRFYTTLHIPRDYFKNNQDNAVK